MSDKDILEYTIGLARVLPELKIVSQRIPADDTYYFAMIDGKSVICLTEQGWAENKILLESILITD